MGAIWVVAEPGPDGGLARISAIAATTLDLDELLHRMMAEAVNLLAAEKGVALLFDEQRQALVAQPAASYGLSAERVGDFEVAGDLSSSTFGTIETSSRSNGPRRRSATKISTLSKSGELATIALRAFGQLVMSKMLSSVSFCTGEKALFT